MPHGVLRWDNDQDFDFEILLLDVYKSSYLTTLILENFTKKVTARLVSVCT